ncbi:hypothetical protein DYB32_001795 [Aphanomyces invadans]|uniref:mannose-6-phosphate isomerase n=1 Tax=Aphanomyces invadans TaxID=157072 RepID=A0A3R6VFG6_9STRA|nr:hypothetical protein DYB32_001795 [Aphanomyces invadans]
MAQIVNNITHVEEFRLLVDPSVATAVVEFQDLPSLRAFFRAMIYCDPTKATAALASLRTRLESLRESLSPLDALVLRLNEQYPNDIGAFSPYLLNYVVLEPGDAVFLGANEPHAYLSGECVECMAGSDNVVRAGLTPKFIDKATLVDMLTYNVGSPPVQCGKTVDEFLTRYTSPVPEFQVERITLPSSKTYNLEATAGPSILLVLNGQGVASVQGGAELDVGTGQVFFVPAGYSVTLTSRSDGLVKKGKKGAKEQPDENVPLHPLKLEVGRLHHGSADPRAAQVISRINMHLQDMKARRLSFGELVVVSTDTSPPTPVMCGTVWPSDKTKPGMVVLGSVWKEVAERASSQAVTVATLSSTATRVVATQVTLQALTQVSVSDKEQSLLGQYVACMMIGMYVLNDAILVLPVHGASRRFQVIQCLSKTKVIPSSVPSTTIYSVDTSTSVNVHWASSATSSVVKSTTPTFQAIGGLQTQIEAVRQLIEQPLIHPTLFASFGLPPPKGVLLYGPPGTGKTLIARSVAHAAQAAVFTINGPELLSKFVGESEANVRLTHSFHTMRADSIKVTDGDVKAAMKVVSPSALREISLDIPRVLWSEIGGQGMIKQQLKEAVEWPLKHPDAFVRMGIRPPKGILLYGPPGCSKTLTAKALATEGGMNFIAIKGPELYSKWVGESEKAIQSIFRKAKAAAPSVVFFDEIDAVASSRGSGSSGVADRVLSQLLNELDGIETLKQVILVAATNRPDLIDSALMRPGRIDRVLYVGPPDEVARAEILTIHTRKMPLAPDVVIRELAKATTRYSGAELASLCREAALCAMQEDVEALHIAKRHFDFALAQIVPQINDSMLAFFDAYRESHARA